MGLVLAHIFAPRDFSFFSYHACNYTTNNRMAKEKMNACMYSENTHQQQVVTQQSENQSRLCNDKLCAIEKRR